jgi:hypothetical protein
MRLFGTGLLVVAALLVFSYAVPAQQESNLVSEVHKNVTLIELPIPAAMPEELKSEYRRFLPLFEAVVTESTTDQLPADAVTIRVEAGTKEIGSKKTERAIAQITASRKQLAHSYAATLLLHSYATGEAVNKEEIAKFLERYILHPMNVIR